MIGQSLVGILFFFFSSLSLKDGILLFTHNVEHSGMAPHTKKKVQIWCGVLGDGSVFSVKIARHAMVTNLRAEIFKHERFQVRFSGPPCWRREAYWRLEFGSFPETRTSTGE
jgi:hypothetical protein